MHNLAEVYFIHLVLLFNYKVNFDLAKDVDWLAHEENVNAFDDYLGMVVELMVLKDDVVEKLDFKIGDKQKVLHIFSVLVTKPITSVANEPFVVVSINEVSSGEHFLAAVVIFTSVVKEKVQKS